MAKSTSKDAKGGNVRITATISSEQHKVLADMAEKGKVSMAWLVRRAVERFIEEYEGPMLPFDR